MCTLVQGGNLHVINAAKNTAMIGRKLRLRGNSLGPWRLAERDAV